METLTAKDCAPEEERVPLRRPQRLLPTGNARTLVRHGAHNGPPKRLAHWIQSRFIHRLWLASWFDALGGDFGQLWVVRFAQWRLGGHGREVGREGDTCPCGYYRRVDLGCRRLCWVRGRRAGRAGRVRVGRAGARRKATGRGVAVGCWVQRGRAHGRGMGVLGDGVEEKGSEIDNDNGASFNTPETETEPVHVSGTAQTGSKCHHTGHRANGCAFVGFSDGRWTLVRKTDLFVMQI